MSFCVWACTCVGGYMYSSTHVKARGQGWHDFSSSTLMWIPGIELKSPGLHDRHLYLLSHFVGLDLRVFIPKKIPGNLSASALESASEHTVTTQYPPVTGQPLLLTYSIGTSSVSCRELEVYWCITFICVLKKLWCILNPKHFPSEENWLKISSGLPFTLLLGAICSHHFPFGFLPLVEGS